MKILLIAIALTAATTVTANEHGILDFKVKQAKYAEAHVKNAGQGSLVLNYENHQVTLLVTRHFSCPEGQVCTQVMPPPMVVQLPVVSITKDSCGIRTVTARQDDRPVDGVLQEMVIKDLSLMNCKTFASVVPTATYKTEHFNRVSGKPVQDESKMTLVLGDFDSDYGVRESMGQATLVKMISSSGFSPEPKTSTLTVDVTGLVMNDVQNHRTGEVTQTAVAQLSSEALQSLQSKVGNVNPRAQLVDQNEGEPQCTDAPTSSVVAYAHNSTLTLTRYAGCHTFQVLDSNAMQITAIMQGLENLSH